MSHIQIEMCTVRRDATRRRVTNTSAGVYVELSQTSHAEVKELKKTSSHSLEFEKSPLQTLFWRLAKNMINDAELVS